MRKKDDKNPAYTLDDLRQIVRALRDPITGCPWDIRQTHDSLLQYLIDETYELVDAISTGNAQEMKDELGDVLFQVVFHASIAESAGQYDFDDIVHHLCTKMINRHQHVFNNPEGKRFTEQEVNTAWQEHKRQERGETKQQTSAVSKVKPARPALFYAHDLGRAAATHGFDWPDIHSVLAKIGEECEEIMAEDANMEEEIGDLLFAGVQLCRKAGLDPEDILRKAAHKFAQRFEKMSEISPLPQTLEEWESRWQNVKKYT